MSGWTNYGVAAIASGTALPQTLYVKHHIGDPGADATANPAYEATRATINLEPGTSPNIATNDASANWSGLAADEVATHFSLWDDATAGNPWAFGAWDPTVALVLAGSAVVAAGKITLTLTVGT